MAAPEKLSTHLRKIHFVLMATCFGILAAVQVEPVKELNRAYEDSVKINKIKEGFTEEVSERFPEGSSLISENARKIVNNHITTGALPVQLVIDFEQNPRLRDLKVYSKRTLKCVRLGDIRSGNVPIKGIAFELTEGKPYFADATETLATLGDFEKIWNEDRVSPITIPRGFSLSEMGNAIAHLDKTGDCLKYDFPPQALVRQRLDVPLVVRRVPMNEREQTNAYAKANYYLAKRQGKDLWGLVSYKLDLGTRPLHEEFSWTGFVHLIEVQSIDFHWRDHIQRKYKLEGRDGNFSEAFPELHKYSLHLKTLKLPALESHISDLTVSEQGSFQIFGAKFPSKYLDWIGILIIISIQSYFIVHLTEFLRTVRTGDNSLREPWMGLYPGGWARTIVVLTVCVFPVFMVGYLMWKEIDRMTIILLWNVVPLLPPLCSVTISRFSYLSISKLWKVCDRSVSRPPSIVI